MTTPTITDVTGTISTGQTLTITGTNMMDVDTTDWDADLTENDSNWETGTTPAANGYAAGSEWSQDTSVKLIGTRSMKWSATGSNQNQNVTYRDGLSTTSKQHFYRWYLREDFSNLGNGSYATVYHKILAIYGDGASKDLNLNWTVNSGSAYTDFYVVIDSGFANEYVKSDIALPYSVHEEGRWYCMELEVPGASPWTFRLWCDGSLIWTHNYAVDPDLSPYDSQFPFNNESASASYGFEEWYDGWVVSDSRVYPASKVEIGDSSNYATANKVYQPPVSISNTSVTVTCDVDGITPTHLFVTNGQNQRVTTAYNLSGGSSALELGNLRIRRDDGSETSAKWIQAEGATAVTASDTNFRVRAIIANNSGSSTTHKYRLEYKVSGGSWAPVGTTGAVQMAGSSNITAGGQNTTQQLTAPNSETFSTGRMWDDENGEDSVTIANGFYTELEWCCTFDSGSTSPLQNYQFRVTRS